MQGKASKVPELVEIAEKHGVSSTQVSLAYIMSKDIIPIPKSTNIEHLNITQRTSPFTKDLSNTR